MIKKDSSAMADPTLLRLADLPSRVPTPISHIPNADALAALAEALDISAVRKLRLEGVLKPMGKTDWRLEARLGATVVQPCVVTLEPVTTRIEEPLERNYLADYEPPTEAELEMDGDDISEALPATLDLSEVAAEALALALPPFPRAEGAELGQRDFAPPGAEPLDDDAVKPFAGLAELKAKMERSGGSDA
ncbi:DUF177 domain-containing protein [Litoreibacter ponti]|uniref:DUF177 domain-containing protein n=1 Tax=Litoreibacter ponti TaxID=1510457 RepID=UPI0031838A3E